MLIPPLPFADAPVQAIGFPVLIVLAWVPYHLRARTLAEHGRPVPRWRYACYVAGLVVLEIAVSPPVDTLSDQLLMAHMAEHLLIGDVAALLLVLGVNGPLLAPLLRHPVVSKLRILTHPVVNLAAPATYKFRVTFRWLGSDGQTLGTAMQLSTPCYQPELRADLLVRSLSVTPITSGASAGQSAYVAEIANRWELWPGLAISERR